MAQPWMFMMMMMMTIKLQYICTNVLMKIYLRETCNKLNRFRLFEPTGKMFLSLMIVQA